jgi:hypothetical protein
MFHRAQTESRGIVGPEVSVEQEMKVEEARRIAKAVLGHRRLLTRRQKKTHFTFQFEIAVSPAW